MPVPARTPTALTSATARAAGVLTTVMLAAGLAAAPAGATPPQCAGAHSMIAFLCPDGTGVGYTCDARTGRWVRSTCPAATPPRESPVA